TGFCTSGDWARDRRDPQQQKVYHSLWFVLSSSLATVRVPGAAFRPNSAAARLLPRSSAAPPHRLSPKPPHPHPPRWRPLL
ncbi:hypothetical protein EJB05_55310, partial [Eragrostis curvula]